MPTETQRQKLLLLDSRLRETRQAMWQTVWELLDEQAARLTAAEAVVNAAIQANAADAAVIASARSEAWQPVRIALRAYHASPQAALPRETCRTCLGAGWIDGYLPKRPACPDCGDPGCRGPSNG